MSTAYEGFQKTRLPTTAHTSRPWRIHDVAPDFELEDVWELPTPGGSDDLARLVQWFTTPDEDGGIQYHPAPGCLPRALRPPLEARAAVWLG